MVNILLTLNKTYVNIMRVLLCSLGQSNPDEDFDVYVAHSSLDADDIAALRTFAKKTGKINIIDVPVKKDRFSAFPSNERWPKEACYRIFAATLLPESVDRVLYLDPDIVINGNIRDLYDLNLDGYCFAACSHMFLPMQIFNRIRLNMTSKALYINSGVILFNLDFMRRDFDENKVYDFVKRNRSRLFLFDQDILNAMYCKKTLYIDPLRFNLDERYFKLTNSVITCAKKVSFDEIRKNAIVIHFCGKNKPWNPDYTGAFGKAFYDGFAEKADSIIKEIENNAR